MGHRDRQPSNKPQQNFSKNKTAFDQVFAVYRQAMFTGVQAMDYNHVSSTSPNRARPTSVEFRIDCDLCIRKVVPAAKMAKFKAAYCFYDSDNPIEHEVVADHVMGPKRHRIEQRLGALFILKGIWPIKQYFSSVRHSIDEWKNSTATNVRSERLREVVTNGEDGLLPVQPTQLESESVVDDAAMTELLTQAFVYQESQGGMPEPESECGVHEAI